MRKLSSKWRRLAVAVAAVSLGACSFDLPGTGPAPDLYLLTPKSTFRADLPTVDWQLVVEEPLASGAVNSDRIVIRDSPTSIKYYKGVRWSDRAPRMVQTLLVESFENSERIVGVGRQAVGLRGDFDLKTELREFQVELVPGEDPIARVRINAKLVRQPSALIVASQTFERVREAKSTAVPDLIEAFDSALGAVLKRVVAWTLVEGQKAQEYPIAELLQLEEDILAEEGGEGAALAEEPAE